MYAYTVPVKLEGGRAVAPVSGRLPIADTITEKFNPRTGKFERVLYGVRILSYVTGAKLLTCPNRFYSRKHAQQWARTFKARYGMGLIRFQTFER